MSPPHPSYAEVSSTSTDTDGGNVDPFKPPDPPVVQILTDINQTLAAIGETPINPTKLKQKTYPQRKAEIIQQTLCAQLGVEEKSSDFDLMINQMKEKFKISTRSEKIQLLALLPSSWSIRRIEIEFATSNFMARSAKRLANEKGVLASPNARPGKALDSQTVLTVQLFYEDDDISRPMPGMKDIVSVRAEGKKIVRKKTADPGKLERDLQDFQRRTPHNQNRLLQVR